MYKEASKLALRFSSSKGNLTVEQLWTLKVDELDQMAIQLEESLDKRARKSFIRVVPSTDRIAELKFNIVLDVLGTKVAENNAAAEAAEIKRHNKTILEAVERRRNLDLGELSEEELLSKLK